MVVKMLVRSSRVCLFRITGGGVQVATQFVMGAVMRGMMRVMGEVWMNVIIKDVLEAVIVVILGVKRLILGCIMMVT